MSYPPSNPTPVIGPLVRFVLVAAPLALYGWHVLSDVLSGRIEPIPIAAAAVTLVLFLGAAWRLGRWLRQTEDTTT